MEPAQAGLHCHFPLPHRSASSLPLFSPTADRILYFALLSAGALESAPALSAVFADLPALFFFSVFSLNTVRYAEIYHFVLDNSEKNKLQPVLIAFNVFIYVFYFVFLALFSLLPRSVVTVNCASPDSMVADAALTAPEIIALAYKAVFLFLCVALAIAFAFYTYKIIGTISGTVIAAREQTSRSDRIRKVLFHPPLHSVSHRFLIFSPPLLSSSLSPLPSHSSR